MHLDVLSRLTNDLADVLELIGLNGGRQVGKDLSGELLGRLEAVPGAGEPLLGGRSVVLGAREGLLEHAPDPLLVLLNIFSGEGLLLKKLVNVDVDGGLQLSNALVHEWLSERRLVSLVVTLLAVADHVDDNILLELGTPIGSKLADEVSSLNIVTVDVEDRSIDSLGNVRAVRGGTGETRVGSETDLVVHNDVDSATSVVSGEVVEAHGFVNDTLASESGVTVKENAHGAVGVLLVVVVVQDSTGLAEHNGVLGLQVRGVGNKGELHTLTRRCGTLEVHAQVVLDIAAALVRRLSAATELREDGLVGLAHNVGQDVKTTSVGHTNDDVLDTVVNRAVDQGLHTRDESLTTLKTETLVVGVLGGKEGFERGRPDHAVQNAALLVNGVLVRLGNLNPLPDPVTLLAIGDVDVLDTIAASVDSLTGVNDLPEGHLVPAFGLEAGQDTRAESEFLVHVRLSEVVVLKIQLFGVADTERLLCLVPDAKRVDLRLVMTAGLVCADKKLDLQVVGDIATGALARCGSKAHAGNAASGLRNNAGRRNEGLADGHVAVLHVLEVDVP